MSEKNENQEIIKIMTLGNSEVGKTSFIMRYTDNIFQHNYLSTTGLDFKVNIVTIKDKQYRVFLYDTAGEERFRSIALNIIKDTDGILLMYDITNRISFECLPEWIKNVKDSKGKDFAMILIGNKIDLEGHRKISKEEGKEFADENELPFFETSNKDGINIQEAALALINKIIENKKKENLDNNTRNINNVLTNKNISMKKNKKKCC